MPKPTSASPPSWKNSVEKLTPRSTGSGGMSNETPKITAELGNSAMFTIPTEEQPDEVAVAEMKMLMEMARSRLLVGDVQMSMRYITLAQQVRPLTQTVSFAPIA